VENLVPLHSGAVISLKVKEIFGNIKPSCPEK
jgi:hypothetical protein